jgi:hypothetical protein
VASLARTSRRAYLLPHTSLAICAHPPLGNIARRPRSAPATRRRSVVDIAMSELVEDVMGGTASARRASLTPAGDLVPPGTHLLPMIARSRDSSGAVE